MKLGKGVDALFEALLTSIHTAISQSREDRLEWGPGGQGQGCWAGPPVAEFMWVWRTTIPQTHDAF